MDKRFLPAHVRLMYRALRHKGNSTLVHAQDMATAKVADRRLVNGEEEFVEWASRWNGKANCFVGRNPRVSGDINALAGITSYTTDVDPIRPKGTASSSAQLASAVSVGRAIAKRFPGGAVFESGNGCQVLHTWPLFAPGAISDFRERSRLFKDRVVKQFAVPGIEIDHIYEPERLVKIPGTLSTKGDPKEWRVARFLDEEDVLKDGSFVLRAILAESATSAPMRTVPTADDLGVKSKSEAQYAMAAFLKSKGFKAEQVLSALRCSPYGKANRDDDNVRIVNKVFSGQSIVQGGQVVEKEVQVYTLKGAMDEHKKRMAERASATAPELPLGFRELDKLLWGLRRGNVLTIGARTGVGKTAFALALARSLCSTGKRVLFFSTEMPVGEIVERVAKAHGSGDPSALDLRICDESSPNTDAVRVALEAHRPDCVVFDYVQHTGDTTSDNRYRELSLFIRGYHDLVREFNCAGVLLSQLNRVAESEPPTLTSLSECGVLENESSAVILMHRLLDDPNAKEVPLMLNVAKNRHGARGTCTLLFKPEEMRFQEAL